VTPLRAQPLNARPKGIRSASKGQSAERRQLVLELTGLACEALEGGPEWTELGGWEHLWSSSHSAQHALNFALHDTPGAFVHRVGERLYLRAVRVEYGDL
jgi:hypothetical protein